MALVRTLPPGLPHRAPMRHTPLPRHRAPLGVQRRFTHRRDPLGDAVLAHNLSHVNLPQNGHSSGVGGYSRARRSPRPSRSAGGHTNPQRCSANKCRSSGNPLRICTVHRRCARAGRRVDDSSIENVRTPASNATASPSKDRCAVSSSVIVPVT
ncbi:hypothetical protein Henu3_gp20 [Mycobacterium phage Henu3]|uniref:Uncharacterized protein n=1 Tax=Mycobacterium phage Henu3 TaxID=2492961 RepID=A0A410T7K0_9CAUD|nr:hypothetical protein I5G68_gp17 [Mycobacterium phage Henu3]QAU04964.1 hypothetical protein Henu3_gp20 [Mycobacterium phage Henu3]